jgi:hypothetical protein
MTYKEFIAVLRKNDVNFRVVNEGQKVVKIDGMLVLLGSHAYIHPKFDSPLFNTMSDSVDLESVTESDLQPMLNKYHLVKTGHNHMALKLLSRFTLTRDGLVKYIREDGTAIYGKDAVKLFKKDMKPVL